MPVIPALWEARAGRSPEFRSLRPVRPTWQNPISTKNTKVSWVWWRIPVIPATPEAEAVESLERRRWRSRTKVQHDNKKSSWKGTQSACAVETKGGRGQVGFRAACLTWSLVEGNTVGPCSGDEGRLWTGGVPRSLSLSVSRGREHSRPVQWRRRATVDRWGSAQPVSLGLSWKGTQMARAEEVKGGRGQDTGFYRNKTDHNLVKPKGKWNSGSEPADSFARVTGVWQRRVGTVVSLLSPRALHTGPRFGPLAVDMQPFKLDVLGADLSSSCMGRLRQENCVNLGGRHCSELRSHHCTPAWRQRLSQKKKEQKAKYCHLVILKWLKQDVFLVGDAKAFNKLLLNRTQKYVKGIRTSRPIGVCSHDVV
ncbi:putative uncharacterized protein C8orf44 [Plecturocebus cupreus]